MILLMQLLNVTTKLIFIIFIIFVSTVGIEVAAIISFFIVIFIMSISQIEGGP